ncbi:carbohydrate kinase family protein [Dactylosporangium aurantiacum]|nr:carbohydrate kinase family protein [Dactylosporangium aurantiacum]MDG6107167.1 carbohydrate kinase family protein [Dactylosporangium aurantiacum]
MVSVDHYLRVVSLPRKDEKVNGRRIGWFAGGMAANFAVAARQFGAEARLVATFGADAEAGEIRRRLTALGIDLTGSADVPTADSLTSYTVVDRDADKTMVIVESDLPLPDPGPIAAEAAGGAWDVVYPVALDAAWCREIGAAARAAGAAVVFDLEPYFVESAWDTPDFVAMMATAEIVFMKLDSVRAAGFRDAAEAAGALRRMGPRVVVTTDGPGEVYCAADDDRFAAVPPAAVVTDTTGAGDAFAGAFCSLYAQRRSVEDCLATATALGTLTVGEFGCQSYAPLRAERLRGVLDRVETRKLP